MCFAGDRIGRWTIVIVTILLLACSVPVGASQEGGGVDAPSVSGPALDRTIVYTYDAAGRLVMVDYGSQTLAYSYDDAGNLVRSGTPYQVYLPLVLKQY
jgi:YD repeat-containing protein